MVCAYSRICQVLFWTLLKSATENDICNTTVHYCLLGFKLCPNHVMLESLLTVDPTMNTKNAVHALYVCD